MIDTTTSPRGGSDHSAGLLVYGVAAFAWTILLGLAVGFGWSRWLGFVWAVCAAALWFTSVREKQSPLLTTAVGWWLRTLVAPAVVLVQVIDNRGRIDSLERDVARLKREVGSLRGSAAVSARPQPRPAPAPEPARVAPGVPTPAPAPVPPPPPMPRELTFDWRGRIESADLLGAKALAWTGGLVTLLGVVFFFVLAANRGWIGPDIRIACGATASVIVFGAGFWLRRRFGETFSSLAAVGAGIAGAYATLLAAASLYDMVSKPLALGLAATIAAVGLVTSLVWESQTVASLGLVGAMVVPGMLVFQGGLSVVGTGFVAIVFAAAATVAVRRRWHVLLGASGGLSAIQAMGQIGRASCRERV